MTNNINNIISLKYDTRVLRQKSKISQYKRDKNFNRCLEVIEIVKDAENKIRKYEIQVKEYNNNIDYYRKPLEN